MEPSCSPPSTGTSGTGRCWISTTAAQREAASSCFPLRTRSSTCIWKSCLAPGCNTLSQVCTTERWLMGGPLPLATYKNQMPLLGQGHLSQKCHVIQMVPPLWRWSLCTLACQTQHKNSFISFVLVQTFSDSWEWPHGCMYHRRGWQPLKQAWCLSKLLLYCDFYRDTSISLHCCKPPLFTTHRQHRCEIAFVCDLFLHLTWLPLSLRKKTKHGRNEVTKSCCSYSSQFLTTQVQEKLHWQEYAKHQVLCKTYEFTTISTKCHDKLPNRSWSGNCPSNVH